MVSVRISLAGKRRANGFPPGNKLASLLAVEDGWRGFAAADSLFSGFDDKMGWMNAPNSPAALIN